MCVISIIIFSSLFNNLTLLKTKYLYGIIYIILYSMINPKLLGCKLLCICEACLNIDL